jgi:hypothetical protein
VRSHRRFSAVDTVNFTLQELMPVKRLTSSKACQSGELTSQRPGIYSLLFDNSESR